MSNQGVGAVYHLIIEEVINSSRVDFEESGVEESVLEELRLGWQQKLSQLDVARFPWDPKPDPPPPAAAPAPPPASSAPTHTQAQFAAPLSLPTAAGPPGGGLPHNSIKNEPGYVKQEPHVPVKQEPAAQQLGMNSFSNYNSLDNKSVAASRAAQQLQAQYGIRAAGSINAIQDRMGQQQQQQQQHQHQQHPQHPQHPQQQQHLHQQQQHLHQQHQPPLPPQGHSTVGNAQTDGPADFAVDDASDDDDDEYEGVLLQRGNDGDVEELGRVEIDRLLHQRMAAKAKSMEGGGLMVSLKEATKDQAASVRAAIKNAKGKGKARAAGVAAFDGGDDDEIDEDAINSDLDDPDEDRDDDEVDDEGLGHIMLCMYDKVQRVKNKWKCTLKDGVLTVNGKEYVFNKATGEYEW